MRPSPHPSADKRPLEMEEDQYRRPSCRGDNDTDDDGDKIGPGTSQMLNLLDQYCL
jgi:hypothetical protein